MTDRRIGMTVEFTDKYGKVVQHKIDKIVALRNGGKAIEIWQDGRKTLLPITGDLKIFSSDDLTAAQDTTSVTPVSNDNTEVTEMRTYAEYLATMTVKTLNALAKSLMLRGYSKLRKATLVEIIARQVGMDETVAYAEIAPKADILSVENPTDHKRIASIMAGIASAPRKVAPVTFSHTSVKPAQNEPKPRKSVTPTDTNPYASEDTDDLIDAIRHMRPVLHGARGERHVRLTSKARLMYAVLKARGINVREV